MVLGFVWENNRFIKKPVGQNFGIFFVFYNY